MVSSVLLRRVALVITDVSEEPGASFIRVTRRRQVPPKRRFLQEPHGVTTQILQIVGEVCMERRKGDGDMKEAGSAVFGI
jgi:hypothetical protein